MEFIKQYKNDLTAYKITSIKNGLVEYCQDKTNYKRGEACYTLKYFVELIKSNKIKIWGNLWR